MTVFKGYYCFGAASQQAADSQQGLCIWMQVPPSRTRKYFMKLLFDAYWIYREKIKDTSKKKTTLNYDKS
jgi:hypothetical protein